MRPHLFAFAILLASPVLAQHTEPTATADAPQARQFDFLIGQWELDVHPKVGGLVAMIHGSPKLAGTLKAWRVLDGRAIEDETRIVDGSGNPISLSRALRVWSGDAARWKVAAIDAYHARSSESTGVLRDGELRMEGRSTDAAGKPVLTRTRYYEIRADGFRMQQDRSTDDGATWEEAVLTIDARRTAATAAP